MPGEESSACTDPNYVGPTPRWKLRIYAKSYSDFAWQASNSVTGSGQTFYKFAENKNVNAGFYVCRESGTSHGGMWNGGSGSSECTTNYYPPKPGENMTW